MLRLLAFVLPLCLDGFAVAAALGARRPTRAQRWRISALIVVFEAVMPVIGVAIGRPLASLIGSAADYVAAAVLVGVGLWMCLTDDDDERGADRLLGATGWLAIGIGISVGLDELAIGFSLGLSGLSLPAVVIAIAIQALIATELGLALGARVGERWRDLAERVAGVVLVLVGVGLIVEKLVR
jgi:putative Mn2+ efflux pump MntP